MPKKSTNRIIKKKSNNNKSLRKNLTKKSGKNRQSDNNQIRGDALTQQSTNAIPMNNALNKNNIRNQLLAKLAMSQFGLGFNPQQYGNLNNEKRVNQLIQDNQVVADTIHKYQAQIDSLKKQHIEQKSKLSDTKSYLEKLKSEKSELEQLKKQCEYDNEQNTELDDRIQKLDLKINALEHENALFDLKNQENQLHFKLNYEKMKKQNLTHIIETNTEFQAAVKLRNQVNRLIAENEGLQKTIDSEEFQNPNKGMEELYHQRYMAAAKKQMLKKQQQMIMENNDINMQIAAALTPNDLKSINDDLMKSIQDQGKINFDLRQQNYKLQQPLHDLENKQHLLEQMQNENSTLNAQNAELIAEDNQLKSRLNRGDKQSHNGLLNIDISIADVAESIGESKANEIKTKQMINQH